MNAVVLFALILVTTAAATVAHELTHAAVAAASGRFVAIDWRAVDVLYRAPDEPDATTYAIAGAPLYVGLLAGVAALGAGYVPPVWLIPAWVLYTVFGAVTNDFDFRTAESARDGEALTQ